MARRALKLASFATVVAATTTTGFYLYSNKHLDPNDFGIVRVGRAVATTAVITFDYLTSLRSIPRGTEEYNHVKSQLFSSGGGECWEHFSINSIDVHNSLVEFTQDICDGV